MLFQILLNIIAPIFIIIFIGFFLAKKVNLDIGTLSKLNFFIFAPALIFVKLCTVEYEWSMVGEVAIYSLIFSTIMLTISFFTFRMTSFRQYSRIMSMCVIFFNSGNYGIPLMLLAFGEKSIPVITIILMLQNLLTFSLGIVLIRSGSVKLSEILKSFLAVPMLYTVILGIAFKFYSVPITEYPYIYEPLNYLSDGLVPIALLTLGCQMSKCKLNVSLFKQIAWVNLFKLIIGPAVAYALATLFNFDPFLRNILVVVGGLPTAINVFILATEYKHGEEISSQIVFSSTLFSSITLTVLIMFLKLL